MRIFLDLDCVLADFVTAGCRAHGLDPNIVIENWPVGAYAMDIAIGRTKGVNLTPKQFWQPFESREFWAELPVLPWARQLVDLVYSFTDEVWIVTSPSLYPLCIPGKQDWCNRFFGSHFAGLIPMKDKYLLANDTSVLIDDYDHNIQEFVRHRGHGIIFPAHHNSRHEYKNDPMTVVELTLRRKLCI